MSKPVLLTVAEARAVVGDAVFRLPTERVPLARAHGRVLARPVHADLDMPPFDKACMDGYAVRAADFADGRATLAVVETIAAGATPTTAVADGQAARIMTGAPMPDGADAVVMIERSTPDGDAVALEDTPTSGQHVQPRGELFAAGDVICPAHTLLRAPELAMLATVGAAEVDVFRRPRVRMVSTGDELVPVDATPGPGQIRDSNSYALAGLVTAHGGDWGGSTRAGDTLDALRASLGAALDDADVLLISGGVSAGDYDLVEPALQSLGIELLLTGVKLKPGKPAVLGVRRDAAGDIDRLIYGLPGNPVSGVVVFLLFGVPALRHLGGRTDLDLPRVRATVTRDVPGEPLWRDCYLPARVDSGPDGLTVTDAGWRGSSDMLALTRANALLVVPADTPPPAAGATAEVLLWRDPLE